MKGKKRPRKKKERKHEIRTMVTLSEHERYFDMVDEMDTDMSKLLRNFLEETYRKHMAAKLKSTATQATQSIEQQQTAA